MNQTSPLTFSEVTQRRLDTLGVAAIYLIGSRATGAATPRSDYDFGVILKAGARAVDEHAYPRLHQKLYRLLAESLPASDPPPPPGMLRDVDVVFLQRAPLYYTTHALKYGRLIFDGHPRLRVRFEENVRRDVMDFQPLRRTLEQALLAST